MGIVPDLSNYFDCEEKRSLQNLEQELDLHIKSMNDIDDLQEYKEMHKEANKIWYKINVKMGALLYKVDCERKSDNRFKLSFFVSVFSLVVSICAICISIFCISI